MVAYPYELATPEQRQLGSLWWCIHHRVKLQSLTEPVENRVSHIREHKPEHEVETRLRAMRPVKGALPVAVVKAHADWEKAQADWLKAYADWRKHLSDHADEIDALFVAECHDVAWGPEGLVFPEVR